MMARAAVGAGIGVGSGTSGPENGYGMRRVSVV